MKKLYLIALLSVLVGCTPADNSANKIDSRKKIVVTTNIIYDAVEFIAGEKNDVTALMGAGVDPHLYKASQKDVSKLTGADMLVYNGLHLEGKMIEVIEKLKHSKVVFSFGDELRQDKIIRHDEFSTPDPHIWFDAMLWSEAVTRFSEFLINWDPANKEHYHQKTEEYLGMLKKLDTYAKSELNSIEENRRVLITAHDAFSYFGRAYNIEVYGLQGISTMAEFGLKDITNLVNFILERNIKSVFIESSVSEKSLKSVVEGCQKKGHQVEIGGMLYSDAMGERNGPEGNYKGMFLYNVNTITKGLK